MQTQKQPITANYTSTEVWKCNPLSQYQQRKSALQFGTVAEVSVFSSISEATQVISDEVTSAGKRQRWNRRERLFIVDNSFVGTAADSSIREWRRFCSPAKFFWQRRVWQKTWAARVHMGAKALIRNNEKSMMDVSWSDASLLASLCFDARAHFSIKS